MRLALFACMKSMIRWMRRVCKILGVNWSRVVENQMQYIETLQGPMVVNNVVCDSITMRAQGCPRSATWSLDFMKVMIGPIR